MFAKKSRMLFVMVSLLAGLTVAGPALASGTPAPQALDLPCVTGISVEVLGQALPATADGQALVSARLTIAPGGGFDAHTHPGTLTVWVDAGSLEFTSLVDAEMSINRAPKDGAASVAEAVVTGEEIAVNPGDWFVEEGGMNHTAWNYGDEPTIVILSGLVDPALPLVQCVEA